VSYVSSRWHHRRHRPEQEPTRPQADDWCMETREHPCGAGRGACWLQTPPRRATV